MKRIVNLKIGFALLALTLFGCEKLKPESVNIPDYPDLESVFNTQINVLSSNKLEKEVWLDGKSESKTLDMDTTLWKKELSFLKEINPNTPEYVGAFEKTETDSAIHLILKSNEKGELKRVSYSMEGKNYSNIKAIIHEDKEVYSHHREFKINLENGLLKNYEITGYQKIVLKDTIQFRIIGVVAD